MCAKCILLNITTSSVSKISAVAQKRFCKYKHSSAYSRDCASIRKTKTHLSYAHMIKKFEIIHFQNALQETLQFI